MRNKNIDIMRGMLIVVVVLGHAIIPQINEANTLLGILWSFIYYFHMPIFFIISGYCCKEIKENDFNVKTYILFASKKFKRLMIPYLFISVINYVILFLLINIKSPISNLLITSGYKLDGILISIFQILTYFNHFDDHVWFLYVLFIIFLILALVYKKINKRKIIAITFFTFLALISYSSLLDNTIPLIEKTFRYLLFFYIGLEIKLDNLKKVNIWKNILSIVSSSLLLFLFNEKDVILLIVSGVLKIILSVNIFIFMYNFIEKGLKCEKIFKCISKYSFDIYLLHQPFITSGISLVCYKILKLNNVISVVIATILGMIIPIIIKKIINRVKNTKIITRYKL